ncbi:hypothetical protein M758_7G144900 [Ceratodon purpureus]|uniref:Secreted protein n=1 Tax=Ceratodon purpureus TaxID=3225 RepID=A0A8T0HAN3_CERPU|nr:hypothetical protein KC19_7G133200 [Ceratodon purpureus]KAG0611500.1 hypothetical protein M758_7G144900 [Ceratodon purpureus]
MWVCTVVEFLLFVVGRAHPVPHVLVFEIVFGKQSVELTSAWTAVSCLEGVTLFKTYFPVCRLSKPFA